MGFSGISADTELRDLLLGRGIGYPVYADSCVPEADVPESYIEIRENGGVRRMTTDSALFGTALILFVHVKLLATKQRNEGKELMILSEVEDRLKDSGFVVRRDCLFKGRDLATGYSYRAINIFRLNGE